MGLARDAPAGPGSLTTVACGLKVTWLTVGRVPLSSQWHSSRKAGSAAQFSVLQSSRAATALSDRSPLSGAHPSAASCLSKTVHRDYKDPLITDGFSSG
jgi:hypothetical protein